MSSKQKNKAKKNNANNYKNNNTNHNKNIESSNKSESSENMDDIVNNQSNIDNESKCEKTGNSLFKKIFTSTMNKEENQDKKEVESNNIINEQETEEKISNSHNNEYNMDEEYGNKSDEVAIDDNNEDIKELIVAYSSKYDQDTREIERKLIASNDRVITKVNDARDMINENIKNIVKENFLQAKEDLFNNDKDIKDNLSSQIKSVEGKTDLIAEYLKGQLVRSAKVTTEINNNTEQIKQISESTNKSVEKIKANVQKLEFDRMSFTLANVDSAVKEMSQNIEVIQGKIKAVDDIKLINEKLDNINVKGKEQEEVRSNIYGDEMLVNIAKYGHKIIDELTQVARNFAQNESLIDNARQEQINHSKQIEECKVKYKEEGKKQGKQLLIKELVSKFYDLDELFVSTDTASEIVVAMLKNNGFDKDEELHNGMEIEITEENRNKMEARAKFDKLGKHKVKKSAFLLNGSFEIKAELEPIEEQNQ